VQPGLEELVDSVEQAVSVAPLVWALLLEIMISAVAEMVEKAVMEEVAELEGVDKLVKLYLYTKMARL